MAAAAAAVQGKSLSLLPEDFVVVQCPPECELKVPPKDPSKISFFSLTITHEECSLIIPENLLTAVFSQSDLERVRRDSGWKCYKVEGPLEFELVGILHGILEPLKQAGISVLAVGTYNTDYFLVKTEHVEKASSELVKNGFQLQLKL